MLHVCMSLGAEDGCVSEGIVVCAVSTIIVIFTA
jgi:hypothetical protein